MRKYLTGDDQIERTLRQLQDKGADKVAKSALGSALNIFKKAMRAAAPVGPTGETRASIGRRLDRSKRGNIVRAKVGVDVGKTKKGQVRVNSNHAYLVALRTHFVQMAYQQARSAATVAMQRQAAKRLAIELKKARS